MPHLIVYAAEDDLAGREADLIGGLTDAVVAVYGDWARDITEVLLIGLPAGRWGVGGRVSTTGPAPRVVFGIRDSVFARPDAADVLGRLVAGVTAAVVGVVGERVRSGLAVEFAGTREGRTGVGGVLSGG